MRYVVELDKNGVVSENEYETYTEAMEAMEKLMQAFPTGCHIALIDKEKEGTPDV